MIHESTANCVVILTVPQIFPGLKVNICLDILRLVVLPMAGRLEGDFVVYTLKARMSSKVSLLFSQAFPHLAAKKALAVKDGSPESLVVVMKECVANSKAEDFR